MANPRILFGKIQKAARIARLVRNFPAVYSHLILHTALHEIRLQSGVTISAGRDVELWRLFHDIWLFEVYTRSYNPIQQDSTVLDVGASVGIFSMFAALLGGKVHSYEPDPGSFQGLLRNVRANPSLCIRPFQYALASTSEPRVLHQFGKSTGNSFFDEQRKPEEKVREVSVECRTLAEVLDAGSTNRCDFVKLNCEGAEFEVLFTSPLDCLSRIETLVVECHDHLTEYTHLDLLKHLDRLGFTTSITLTRKDSTAVLLARRT